MPAGHPLESRRRNRRGAGRRDRAAAPTVVRLLQTLVELGYATRISREAGYRLTDKVLGLAQGIRFVDHLIDVAAPHMSRFTKRYGWPLYLGTISDRAITIRHSTAVESPMSFERAALQRAARSCRARSAAPGSPSVRPRSGAPSCTISA